MKSKSEQIYEAIGEGYGFNGSKEECIKIIENILKSVCEHDWQELAEEFADEHERRGCAYWNGLYRGYIAGKDRVLMHL